MQTAKILIRLGGCWAHSHFVDFVMSQLNLPNSFDALEIEIQRPDEKVPTSLFVYNTLTSSVGHSQTKKGCSVSRSRQRSCYLCMIGAHQTVMLSPVHACQDDNLCQ